MPFRDRSHEFSQPDYPKHAEPAHADPVQAEMPVKAPAHASAAEAISPAEVLAASPDAVYIYVGTLEDGTKVVRASNGLLHAAIPIKQPS